MSTVLFTDLSSYFNNIDPEDPVYQKDLIRPAEIKEDVKLMEQRKRVTNIMRSKLFKKDLENIFLKYKFDDEDVGDSTSNLSLADISEQLLLTAMPKNRISNLNQLSNKKGIMCINDLSANGSMIYTKTERQCRCKLASIFRLIDMYGWNSNFDAVMTTRPFSDKEQFFINPFGLLYHEVTASSLITVDFRGNILDFGSTILEASPIAWLIHSAVYSCRNSIRTILELKTSAAIAVSSLEHGLLPISKEAIILGPVAILSNLPVCVSESKPSSLIRADVKNYLTSLIVPNLKILIVPNCGILICGDTIEEAWHLFMNCQVACETQLKLGNLSTEDLYIPDWKAQIDLFDQWRSTDLGGITPVDSNVNPNEYPDQTSTALWRLGELEFEALMRHMDNNGYRTGYFYRQESILQIDQPAKSSKDTKIKYEVEIPASSTSLLEEERKSLDTEEESKLNKAFNRSKSEKWFNTPNTYKLIEDSDDVDTNLSYNFSSQQSDKKTARWGSVKVPNLTAPTPQHPVNAGAYVLIGHQPPKPDKSKDKVVAKINPKELIENQKRVKNKYYYDTNTAGPISCLLDSGLSREEARMIKNESLKKQLGPMSTSPNDQVVTSASKGIIQRGHKAVVYQDLFKSANPFDVSSAELENYHKEVDRKLNPEKYHAMEAKIEDQSKEDAPEIKITLSATESSLPPPADNDNTDLQFLRRDTESSNQKQPLTTEHFSVPNESFERHPFFQSDFDEDINNLKYTVFRDDNIKRSNASTSLNLSGDNIPGSTSECTMKSGTMKEPKKKSYKSFSFKKLGRHKSARESAELVEQKAATLAAPGHGTMTSETSGVDISNDELDKDTKSKKKKRKFKLPSFSKKHKDKSK